MIYLPTDDVMDRSHCIDRDKHCDKPCSLVIYPITNCRQFQQCMRYRHTMHYRQNFMKADNYQIRNQYSLVSPCIPSLQYPPDKDSSLRLFNEYHIPNPLTKRKMSTPTEAKPHNDFIQSDIMTPLPAECPKITNSVAIPIKWVLYLLISCTLNCMFKDILMN